MEGLGGESTGQRGMEVENQEGQGPLRAVVPLMMTRDEILWQWRKLHSGELHDLWSLRDIIRQIKSRRMKWAGHVARM
jgi:hypothetical protein